MGNGLFVLDVLSDNIESVGLDWTESALFRQPGPIARDLNGTPVLVNPYSGARLRESDVFDLSPPWIGLTPYAVEVLGQFLPAGARRVRVQCAPLEIEAIELRMRQDLRSVFGHTYERTNAVHPDTSLQGQHLVHLGEGIVIPFICDEEVMRAGTAAKLNGVRFYELWDGVSASSLNADAILKLINRDEEALNALQNPG